MTTFSAFTEESKPKVNPCSVLNTIYEATCLSHFEQQELATKRTEFSYSSSGSLILSAVRRIGFKTFSHHVIVSQKMLKIFLVLLYQLSVLWKVVWQWLISVLHTSYTCEKEWKTKKKLTNSFSNDTEIIICYDR